MICFHFTIFVVLETTHIKYYKALNTLWFAFILLSLSYWKQPLNSANSSSVSCDLLSFYYLCRTGNNFAKVARITEFVVICFHFTIFVVLETTDISKVFTNEGLWFAFILLSLSYWKQPECGGLRAVGGCDLLSFYYLCRTGNNFLLMVMKEGNVVICFHFTIFVVLETTTLYNNMERK